MYFLCLSYSSLQSHWLFYSAFQARPDLLIHSGEFAVTTIYRNDSNRKGKVFVRTRGLWQHNKKARVSITPAFRLFHIYLLITKYAVRRQISKTSNPN